MQHQLELVFNTQSTEFGVSQICIHNFSEQSVAVSDQSHSKKVFSCIDIEFHVSKSLAVVINTCA